MIMEQEPIYLQMLVGGINHGPILVTEVQASTILRRDRPSKARVALTENQIKQLGIDPEEMITAKI